MTTETLQLPEVNTKQASPVHQRAYYVVGEAVRMASVFSDNTFIYRPSSGGVLWYTTRDTWANLLDAPQVSMKNVKMLVSGSKEDGHVIEISANSRGGSKYDHGVLGYLFIQIRPDGSIKGYPLPQKYVDDEGMRDLTYQEVLELGDIFIEATERLKGIAERHYQFNSMLGRELALVCRYGELRRREWLFRICSRILRSVYTIKSI